MFRKQKKKKKNNFHYNITTIFILLLFIYYGSNILLNSNIKYINSNSIVLANSLTNNRILYVDNSGKLNTTDTTPDELIDIKNNIANIQDTLSNTQQQLDSKQGTVTGSDGITVNSNNNITINKSELLNMIYPVGSIYISVSNVSPATFLGGTWASIGSGRTLVGVNTSDSDFNTVEKTGGEKTHIHTTASHTLTINEIPSHNHSINDPGHKHNLYTVRGYDDNNHSESVLGTGDNANYYWSNANCSSVTTGISINNTGGGQAHSHGNTGSSSSLQPYITVYMWKRTN